MRHFFLYLDPGSGSYLVQAIVAAVLAVPFFFKNLGTRIGSYFKRSGKPKPSSDG